MSSRKVSARVSRKLVPLAIAAAVLGPLATAASATWSARGDASRPPAGLSTYGQTLWNLEALLHDKFGNKTVCLRLRDYAFISNGCGDLAHYGYWKNIFVGARHSRFTLVRRSRPPVLGNVAPVTVGALYVSCGRFPVAFPGSARHPTPRWLVVLHGWAMVPFTCF